MTTAVLAESWLGATDGGRVPELCRHLLHNLDDFTLEGLLAGFLGQRRFGQEGDCPQSRAPGAEVFGGELLTHGLAQVIIDLARIDQTAFARIGHVLEQVLARELLTVSNDPGDSLVVDENFMLHAALAAEIQHRPSIPNEAYVSVTQRRQAKALVIARILGIADAYSRGIEKGDDNRKHLLARQAGQRKIAIELAPQLRQRLAEHHHAIELRAVAHLPPLRMITILFAAAGIPTGGLQVAVRPHADPHVAVGRRHGQACNAFQFVGRLERAVIGSEVSETVAHPPAANARFVVGHIGQTRIDSHACGLERDACRSIHSR